MVKTKSIGDPIEEVDGSRILVTRYWPRPFKRERLRISEWCRSVAPSRELLRDWRDSRISWADYEKRYLHEMTHHEQEIRRLDQMASCGSITLLCFEPEGDPHCHRHLLKRLIEEQVGGARRAAGSA